MLIIGDERLTLEDFGKVLFGNEEISISPASLNRVMQSYNFLNEYCNNKIIYGINTGLGPMAQYQISSEERISLQYNAIRSHCSGLGDRIPDVYVRSAMICMLNAYLQGHSGVHPELVELLAELINRSIIPVVPEHGGVGASGDLVQLAHVALVLIGEGDVSYKGEIKPTADVFSENNLKPITVHLREGLALINGTYIMTGIGIVNLINAINLQEWSVAASAMINEIVRSFDDYFSEELNEIKHHHGQQVVASKIRAFLNNSELIRKRKDYFFDKHSKEEYLEDKVQEYYSVRCVPQILGPVYECLENAVRILVEEANSSSDNPVVDLKSKSVFHGGNFHGDYVSSEMDKIKTAIVKLSMLAERQSNFLFNSKLNNILPPFINLGKLGSNFGMQGVQFTSTSTCAENQTLAFPMSVHSISCNNDNQDIVSMGTNSALLTKRVIDNAFQILAIEMMAIIQAFDYLDIEAKSSDSSRKVYKSLRNISPVFKTDSVRYKEIEAIKIYIFCNNV